MTNHFAEKIVMPMDEMNDEEGLAFWLHWKEECMTYQLQKRLLKSRRGGRVEFHLKKKLCAWGRRHVKSRKLLSHYIKSKNSHACRWRNMREKMHCIMKHECGRNFHCGYCRCPKCVKMYYVKGNFTMIVVRIKDRIYELRQFDDEARNCLMDMIRKKELTMVAARKNREPAATELPLSRSIYLCQKYNYSQDVVESMKLACED